jgi:hydroxyacylglutathione hydrolase
MKLPDHFNQNQATGIQENHPIAQFEIGRYKNFVYLILDWQTKYAAIVDPQTDLSFLLSQLEQHGFQLKAILLTHTHFDHIAGLPQLVQDFPQIPVFLHSLDLNRIEKKILKIAQIHTLQDKEIIPIGNIKIRTLHTPGHSAGECCFFIEGNPPFLLTGDTVFIRDCGRTDLETGSNEEMFQSLQRIKQLPPETVILPGHHYQPECASTLERELQSSPPFQCQSVLELANLP